MLCGVLPEHLCVIQVLHVLTLDSYVQDAACCWRENDIHARYTHTYTLAIICLQATGKKDAL